MEKRNEMIDVLKGILIYLVTLGHTLQVIYEVIRGSETFYDDKIFRIIYSFHMPAFMIISGYLFYKTSINRNFQTTINKKNKSLLIPIISWNVLGYIFIYLPTNLPAIKSFTNLCKSFVSYATLWFLVSVFINSVIAAVIIQIEKRIPNLANRYTYGIVNLLFITGMCMVIPMGENYTFMLPMFFFGYFLAKYEKGKSWFNPAKNLTRSQIIVCIVFVILLPFFKTNMFVYTSGVFVKKPEQMVIDFYRWGIGVAGTASITVVGVGRSRPYFVGSI